jgi:perosamine synthetase
MTTGEGGIVTTDNEKIDAMAKSMRNQGRDEGMGWLAHNRLGYNYRLSDINCALGIVQLSRINELLEKRQNVADMYNTALSGIKEIILPPGSTDEIKRSWFVYVVRLTQDFSQEQRNETIMKLRARGIGCNVYFPPIHLQPFYVEKFGYKEGDFPVTESVSSRTIAIPFYNKLSKDEVKYVSDNLAEIIKEVR